MKKLFNLFFIISSFFQLNTVQASQPIPVQVQVQTEVLQGSVILSLQNFEKESLAIEFYPGALSTVKFAPARLVLTPGEKAQLKLQHVEFTEGRQVLHMESSVMSSEQGGSQNGPFVHETLWVSRGVPKKISFEEGFLRQRVRLQNAEKSEAPKIDLGGFIDAHPISALTFKANSIPANMRIQPFRFASPLEYARLKPRQLPRPSEPQNGKPPGLTPPNFTPEEVEITEPSPEVNASFTSPSATSPSALPFDLNTNSTLTLHGTMSLQTAPGTYKAAWGWVVKTWQWQTSMWRFLGWTYVGGDGSWSIQFASNLVLPGVPVRVEYLTKNRFISLQDPSGNPYAWGDDWTLTGTNTDIGSRYADLTVNGNLPGVDQLYVGATHVWVKFYNTGMNALRDEPIQVTFANALSTGQCVYKDSNGNPYAWSCSYWSDGKIYIIPAHANEGVVQHEIGHSINSYYWNGNMPSDAGGTHTLKGCFTNGLALTEGFADFLAYWVQLDRNTSAPTITAFNMNLESLPSNVCNGQTNEMRVAATFWDLYDYWNDGSGTSADTLLYTDQATSVAIYLNNNKSKMADYLAVTQAGQNAYWQGELTKLFKLNTIIP